MERVRAELSNPPDVGFSSTSRPQPRRVDRRGDSVFLRSTLTGTHDGEYKGIPSTGRHVSAEAAEVFRIRDGQFVGYWCLTNVAGLMRQLTEEPALAPTAAS